MNKKLDKQKPPNRIKIEELCQRTGFSRTAVYRYIRMGLVPDPLREGFRSSFYDETHVRMLSRIKYLREQEKLSLSEIAETLRLRAPEGKDLDEKTQKRQQIIDKATLFFSRKAYQDTRISDITDALGIGKGTFYLYFRDKRELFLECMQRVLLVSIPEERWDEIRQQRHPVQRMRKRAEVLLESFPDFIGALDLIRLGLRSKDKSLSDKAKKSFQMLSSPMARDAQWAMKHGVVRQIDPELYGYFTLVMSEVLGYRMLIDNKYTAHELLEAFSDFISHAILCGEDDKREKAVPKEYAGELSGRNGEKTLFTDIRIDDREFLPGRVGEAEVKVDLGKIATLSQKDLAEGNIFLRMKSGEKAILQIDINLKVSGQCSLGLFTIPITHVAGIVFFDNSRPFSKSVVDRPNGST